MIKPQLHCQHYFANISNIHQKNLLLEKAEGFFITIIKYRTKLDASNSL